MSVDRHTANLTFDQYFQALATQQQAVLPDERLAVLEQMERELTQQGVVPIGEGEIAEFNVDNPTYAAILRGDAVTVGGEPITQKRGGIQSLPIAGKIGLLLAVFLIPVLLFGVLIVRRSQRAASEVEPVAALITPTLAATTTLDTTETPLPTPNLIIEEPTPTPTITPTPLPITALRGEVAPDGSDPASIEVAGEAFILAVGTMNNGIWQPRGAEWLQGSRLRRVIAIPHSPALATKLNHLTPSIDNVQLRLRSGEVIGYTIRDIGRYRRDQIETLAGGSPSIAVVLSGEEGDTRTVIVGVAVQPSPLAPTQLPVDEQNGHSDGGELPDIQTIPVTDTSNHENKNN